MSIHQFLSNIDIPEKESIDLLGISRITTIKKDDYYIRQGQIPKRFAIVQKGLFRYYYIDKEGNEYTKGFIIEGSVLSSYSAMLYQTPSHFFIQAIEDGVILDISYDEWLVLQEKNNYWDKFLISALQKGYCAKEKRERELLLLDAETRYQIFLDEFPDIEKRVKLQTIASYLGIRAESLSRIRKKMTGLT